MIINTHSHIYDEAFDNDREEVFSRALDSGVEMLLLPNTDEFSVKPMMDFFEKHSQNSRIMINGRNGLEITKTGDCGITMIVSM